MISLTKINIGRRYSEESYAQKRKINVAMRINKSHQMSPYANKNQTLQKQQNSRITAYLSILTLNINSLNSLIKRYRIVD
jgi:hypothetical protein